MSGAPQPRQAVGLAIQGVKFRMEAAGLYCLHCAAGAEKRHGPSYWLANQQAAEMIAKMETTGIRGVTVEGRNGDTFVCKELVHAYAMWISAAFHLKVARAYDAIVAAAPVAGFAIPPTLSGALRLAADLADKAKQPAAQVAERAPKVVVLDRISIADGSLCITDAEKVLDVGPKALFVWSDGNKWMYRGVDSGRGGVRQDKIISGVLAHKTSRITSISGGERMVTAIQVTPRGLAELARKMARARKHGSVQVITSTCRKPVASYTRDVPETAGAGIGVPMYRRTSRQNAAIFTSVGTVTRSFNGRAVRGVARPTGSCTRHANPHGSAPPIGVGAAVNESVVQEAAMPNALAHPAQTQSTFLFSPKGARFATERAERAQLRWIGDGIGLDASQAAKIHFLDQIGSVVSLTLGATLARADEINARGLYRILAAARCAFEAGDLSEADAQAWQQADVEALAAADCLLPAIAGAA